MIILMISISNQWQRFSLAYAANHKIGEGDDSYYQIEKEYPDLKTQFGLINGTLFLIPYSVFGLVSGQWTDGIKRKTVAVGIVCMLWSATTFAMGYFESYSVFIGCRVLLGVFESFFNPLAYSLIRDYFPASQRATANSIFASGVYTGQGASSLSILLISNYGWRNDFLITGSIGMILGVLPILILKEPIHPCTLVTDDTDEINSIMDKEERQDEVAAGRVAASPMGVRAFMNGSRAMSLTEKKR